MINGVPKYDDVIGDRNKINLKLHEIIGKSIHVSRSCSSKLYMDKRRTEFNSNGVSNAPDLKCKTSNHQIVMSKSSWNYKWPQNENDENKF